MQEIDLTSLNLFIVEDEVLLRKQLTAELERLGADVTGAATLKTAREFLNQLDFDFALLDVNLPDGKGTDLLREKAFSPHTGVIVMTADGAVSGAVEAMRLGAVDYLVKPFDPLELALVIQRARRARQSARLEEHRREDRTRSGDHFVFSPALAGLEMQLQKILAADQRLQSHLPPVLIEGETGTGKTTIARWLHYHGPRASQPLVEMNCSAVPESLAESELFGHERGAFTDARTARLGLFEAAQGGTLFLDELPSLSLALQAKLLTAIEDHRIRRLGGNKSIPIDVRLIAAANRPLKQLVIEGKFREDLYHRLDLCRLHLPPLRERAAEIVPLAEILMKRLCQRHRLPVKQMTAAACQRLQAYHWPGNVRELAHELERAIIFDDSAQLNFAHLLPDTEPGGGGSLPPSVWFNEQFAFPAEGFSLDAAINHLVHHALKQSHDNVSAAARLLGVTRDYVRYRLNQEKGEAGGAEGAERR